jgi:hypothetical protein
MIDTDVSSLAHDAIDATAERLLEIASPLQEKIASAVPPPSRKPHRLLRIMLLSVVLAAIGIGIVQALQRRSQTRETAPDPFGDAAEREQRARDFATLT